MSQQQKILVIVGPTASGKSSLALSIARQVPSEIISADSRQIYRTLTIGTAKPLPQELAQTPHHFIDLRDPDQKFNAGNFQEEGRKVIDTIIKRDRLPIIVGGTGLYIQAIVDGFFELPKISGDVRDRLEQQVKDKGKESLFKELQSVDPVSAATMDATKYRRVIRALEVFYETGTPISKFHQQHAVTKHYDARFFGLHWSREDLYERINLRVDHMLTRGFVDEVRQIQSKGYDDRYQSLQTVGYKEAFAFLRGEISKERMIELMKQNTRRFAKRQTTWFKRDERITWFPISDESHIEVIAKKIINLI